MFSFVRLEMIMVSLHNNKNPNKGRSGCEILGMTKERKDWGLIVMCLYATSTRIQFYWMVLYINLTQAKVNREKGA